MKTKTIELPGGDIEIRIYDNAGRLTEIRKKSAPAKIDRPASMFNRTPARYNRDH